MWSVCIIWCVGYIEGSSKTIRQVVHFVWGTARETRWRSEHIKNLEFLT